MREELLQQYKQLHEQKKSYGSGASFFNKIHNLLVDNHIKGAIDFGCGKGMLAKKINEKKIVSCWSYDPAIPEFSALPCRHEAVICNDVMEHMADEDHAIDTLKLIKSLAYRLVWFNISCREAAEILPDGRNAHTLVRHPLWWVFCIEELFDEFTPIEYSYHVRNKHLNFAMIKDDKDKFKLSYV